jgi:ELWxxDGT repeat protein
VDGVALFTASDGIHGAELWRSDGTAEGTVEVQDIAPGPASSNPADLELVRDRVCFSAHDGIHGRELWCGWAAILTGRPEQAIADLRDRVLELGLGRNAEAGLLAKLATAEQAIARDAAEVASGALQTFAAQVSDKLQREIPIEDADDLIELAQQTANLLVTAAGP